MSLRTFSRLFLVVFFVFSAVSVGYAKKNDESVIPLYKTSRPKKSQLIAHLKASTKGRYSQCQMLAIEAKKLGAKAVYNVRLGQETWSPKSLLVCSGDAVKFQ